MLSVGILSFSLAHPQIGHWTRCPCACSCLSVPQVLRLWWQGGGNGKERENISGKQEHLSSGLAASGAAPATGEPLERATGLDPRPGTPAATQLMALLRQSSGWKIRTALKCDSAVPRGGAVGSAGIGRAAS